MWKPLGFRGIYFCLFKSRNIVICFFVSDLHPLCVHSKHRDDYERSIFVRLKEGGYKLRENILFHLYVSTSPCGDARLNSPYEITTDCKKPQVCLLSINNARPGSLWLSSVPGHLGQGILCVVWMDGWKWNIATISQIPPKPQSEMLRPLAEK